MKLQHMSFFTPIATLAAILVAGSLAHAQVVIVSDNFDSYTTGTLANNAPFPTAIPGYGASWFRGGGGSAEIADATSYGRTGKVFSVTENGAQFPQASLNLTSAFTGTDTWTAKVDVYIDALTNTGGFGALTVLNGSNRLGSIGIFVSGTSNFAFFGSAVGSAGSGVVFTNFTNALALDTWYTFKISGNNSTKAISGEIVGFTPISTNRFYETNTSSFGRIIVGDNGSGSSASTTLAFDDFSLSAVPEPGSIALAAFSGLALLLYRRRARSRG